MTEVEDAAALAVLGDVQLIRGDPPAALKSYQASHDVFERLANADPADAGRQLSLAASHIRIGDVQAELNDLAAALKSYQASLAIAG